MSEKGYSDMPATPEKTAIFTSHSVPLRSRAEWKKPRSSAIHSKIAVSVRASDAIHSEIISPDPPASAGKSLNFGNPSFMGRTVSA